MRVSLLLLLPQRCRPRRGHRSLGVCDASTERLEEVPGGGVDVVLELALAEEPPEEGPHAEVVDRVPEDHRGGGERVEGAHGALHDVGHDHAVDEAAPLLLLHALRLQSLLLLNCSWQNIRLLSLLFNEH